MGLSLLAESVVWYTIALIVFLVRICTRFLHGARVCTRVDQTSYNFLRGIRRLPGEDWLMLLAFAFYSAEIVTMNITADLQSNLLPPGYLETHTLSAAEISNRIFGSKMTLVVEQCQICTIWLIKCCLLWMWYDITDMAYQTRNRIVICLGAFVVLSWIVMESLYFGVWCQPFSNYWAVPTPNPEQCAAALDHLKTNAAFNLFSDVILLSLSVSIAWDRTFTGIRRAGFWILCGLGVFIILCAILNKVYSFTNPFGSQWTFWYIRECSTAIILSNLAYAWKAFFRLANFIYLYLLKVLGVQRPLRTSSRGSSQHARRHWHGNTTVVSTQILAPINGVKVVDLDSSTAASTLDPARRTPSSSSTKSTYKPALTPQKSYNPYPLDTSRLITGRQEAEIFSDYSNGFYTYTPARSYTSLASLRDREPTTTIGPLDRATPHVHNGGRPSAVPRSFETAWDEELGIELNDVGKLAR